MGLGVIITAGVLLTLSSTQHTHKHKDVSHNQIFHHIIKCLSQSTQQIPSVGFKDIKTSHKHINWGNGDKTIDRYDGLLYYRLFQIHVKEIFNEILLLQEINAISLLKACVPMILSQIKVTSGMTQSRVSKSTFPMRK